MARMTAAALLAALALGAACQTPEPGAPRSSTAAPAAVPGAPALWVPNEAALNWDDFLATLRWNSSLRLTAAISPSALPEGMKGELSRLSDEGRVEFALRLPQDPVLPLLTRLPADDQGTPSRAADVAEQLALARQAYRD